MENKRPVTLSGLVAYRTYAGRASATIATCALAASCAAITGLDGYELLDVNDGGSSPNNETGPNTLVDGSSNTGDGQVADSSNSDALLPSDAGKEADVEEGPPPNPIYLLTTSHSVYVFEPRAKTLSPTANFDNCDNPEDLALSSNGVFLTTGQDRISVVTASGVDAGECKSSGVKHPQAPDAIAMAGKNLFAAEEVLVGFEGSRYSWVSLSGSPTTVADNAVMGGDTSDVAIHGSDGYAVVQGGPCAAGKDCIVAFNAKTGASLGKLGDLPVSGVQGLAYTRGKLYAFTTTSVYVATPSPFAVEDVVTIPPLTITGAASTPEE